MMNSASKDLNSLPGCAHFPHLQNWEGVMASWVLLALNKSHSHTDLLGKVLSPLALWVPVKRIQNLFPTDQVQVL